MILYLHVLCLYVLLIYYYYIKLKMWALEICLSVYTNICVQIKGMAAIYFSAVAKFISHTKHLCENKPILI